MFYCYFNLGHNLIAIGYSLGLAVVGTVLFIHNTNILIGIDFLYSISTRLYNVNMYCLCFNVIERVLINCK